MGIVVHIRVVSQGNYFRLDGVVAQAAHVLCEKSTKVEPLCGGYVR